MFANVLRPRRAACALALLSPLVHAVTLDPTNYDSIRNATKLIATDMMAYYTGNLPGQTPGYLPGNGQPGGYFWWIGGGMFATMIDYWYHTGDSTWNDITSQAIYFQSDPSSGGYFDSANVSLQLGNDDQSFWAFAALDAAEYVFPNPPSNYPSWIAMAQGVWNQQVQRWDNSTCGGGLRWQAVFTNAGYNYKNAISNGCFFQVGARLGKYTGNHTYIDWAIETWDWSVSAGLINVTNNYEVIDGIYVNTCTPSPGTGAAVSDLQWTYNVGVYLYGAAALWNITQTIPAYADQASLWQERTLGLLNGASVFFPPNTNGIPVLSEVICEPYDTCAVDSSTFKAYLARWMRVTAIVAPFTAEQVTSMLSTSVPLAAESCDAAGMNDGAMCGQEWYLVPETYDGRSGIGEQMNALEVIQTLIPVPGPVSLLSYSGSNASSSQNLSQPDSSIGASPLSSGTADSSQVVLNVTSADRGGAWFLFVLFALGTIGGALWVMRDPSADSKIFIEEKGKGRAWPS